MEQYNIDNYFKSLAANYGAVNEQAAVLSSDLKERIKEYLDNDDLLEKMAVLLKDLEPGTETTFKELNISKEEYGIRADDTIKVKRLPDGDTPKFAVSIYNVAEMIKDIDLGNACLILYRAAKGMGTDEDSIADVAGAIIQIAASKNIEPHEIFKLLEKEYANKYGESLKDMLEGEFSGRAEAAVLNAFRLKIEDSVIRGLNWGTILADLGLTILSFGGGTALSTAFKGASAGGRTWKFVEGADKLDKVNKLGKLGRIGSKIPGIRQLIQSWDKMSKGMKIARLRRLQKSGKVLQYSGPGADAALVPKIIAKIESGQVFWLGSQGGHVKGPAIRNLVSHGGLTLMPSSLAMLVPGNAKKIAAAASVGTRLDTVGSDANFAEIMGWYDSLTADPESYVENVKAEGSGKLAETLLMLKDGSGLFGNTTDQEELQIALILTSIDSETAKEVEAEYQRKGEGTVTELIIDELGGDLATITAGVWKGLTGNSTRYVSKIIKE